MTGVDNCLLESFWVCIFLFSPQKKGTELIIWSDGCVHYLDLGHQFHKVYVYQIVLLCTLHTYNSILFLNKVGGKSKEAEFETCSCTLYSGNIQSLFQLKRKVSGFWKDEKPEKTVLKEGVWSGNERSWMNLDERNSRGTWRKRKWEEGREVITLEIRTKIWKDDFWTDLQRKVSKTWKQEKKRTKSQRR